MTQFIPRDRCVGDIGVKFGKWYSRIGEVPGEITWCEWCVRNGCISMDSVADAHLELTPYHANFDCSLRYDHPQICAYVCAGHVRATPSAVGRCEKCDRYTSSAEYRFCASCSAYFGICYICGERDLA
jgi:hypothetical protein